MYSNVKSVSRRSLNERDEYILKLNNKKYNSNQTGVSQPDEFSHKSNKTSWNRPCPTDFHPTIVIIFGTSRGHWSLFTTC